jgi:hypothetical protein
LSPPRWSTIRPVRATAKDAPPGLKSLELEQRLSRLEVCCREMQEQLATLLKRMTALQAEFDHFSAKNGR